MFVVHSDNHILVVRKAAGIATQPTLVDLAKAWVKNKENKPGNVFLEPIHRLDQVVSGLVLFARTSKALSRLQEAMREQKIERYYHALVDPLPVACEGVLDNYLLHDDRCARVVPADYPGAKRALLSYRVVKENCLAITLQTGRYHQIRVQCAASGFPIRGDKKYGSQCPWKGEGIALHHTQLILTHPVTKERMVFEDQPFWRGSCKTYASGVRNPSRN